MRWIGPALTGYARNLLWAMLKTIGKTNIYEEVVDTVVIRWYITEESE